MLKPLKAQEIINILLKLGCIVIRQKGSHVVLRRQDLGPVKGKTIIMPFHGSKDVPIPTIKSILRQGGISENEFMEVK